MMVMFSRNNPPRKGPGPHVGRNARLMLMATKVLPCKTMPRWEARDIVDGAISSGFIADPGSNESDRSDISESANFVPGSFYD